MIDENKLIEELARKIFTADLYEYGWNGQTVDNLLCLGDVIDIINDQTKAGKWVPASQPPNNIDEHQCSEDVIVKLKWYDGDISYSVGWYSKKYGWSENCDNCEVIEWTSIPNKKEDSTMRIKIKYHTNITPLGRIGGSKSDWIDLRAAEDVFIPQGECRLISLGVSMQLPDGYEAHVVPRSSTFKNYGIIQTNHMGIIDNSYCGDNDIWHFPALCLIGKDIVNGSVGTMIHKNDRICQFRIANKQPDVAFLQVDKLGNEDRGGIGSTGRR